MFEAVLKLSIEDYNRSNKIIAYAQLNSLPIYGSVDHLYQNITRQYTVEYLEDLTNATSIADAIYNSLP